MTTEAAAGFYTRNHLSMYGANGMSSYAPSHPRDGRGLRPIHINYIPQFSAWLQGSKITNLDYLEILDAPGAGVMCFVDPPYSDVGKSMYPFGEADLEELARHVRASVHSCLITVDDSPANRVAFSDMHPIVHAFTSNMGNIHKSAELICANYSTPLYAIHARKIGVEIEQAAPLIQPNNDDVVVVNAKTAKKGKASKPANDNRKSRVLFSSKTDQWFSPRWLMEAIYQTFEIDAFDLDPCSPPENLATTKAKNRFSLELGQDGLALPWNGNIVYMNPPYGRQIGRWLRKAKAEIANGNSKTIIGLVPVRTDTGWWQDNIATDAPLQWMVRGRLRFGEAEWTAPFSSVIVIWGDPSPFLRALENGFADQVKGYLVQTKVAA